MTDTQPNPEDDAAREASRPAPDATTGQPSGDPYSVPRFTGTPQQAPGYTAPYATGGATPPPQGGWAGSSSSGNTNQLAIISLVASVASFIFLPFIGAVAGIITGFMARKQIRENGQDGDKLALWGIIVGFAHIVLGALAVVFFLLIFIVAGVSGAHSVQQRGDQTQQCIDQYQTNPQCELTSP